jgi:hypothetical protein
MSWTDDEARGARDLVVGGLDRPSLTVAIVQPYE